jgi:hypothetical protein
LGRAADGGDEPGLGVFDALASVSSQKRDVRGVIMTGYLGLVSGVRTSVAQSNV